MEAPRSGYTTASSPATAPSTPDSKMNRGTTRFLHTRGSPELKQPFSSPPSPSQRKPIPTRKKTKNNDSQGEHNDNYNGLVHRNWFEKSGNLYFPVRTALQREASRAASSSSAIPTTTGPSASATSSNVPTTTTTLTLASLAGRSIPPAAVGSTGPSLTGSLPLRSPVSSRRPLHLSPLARAYAGKGSTDGLPPTAARAPSPSIRLDGYYYAADGDADPPQVKQERSEGRSRKEMLVAAMAELQAELSEIERSEQQQASSGADESSSRGKKGSGGFLKVTRGKGTNSPALRLSSGEEVVDVIGGYAAAYAQHSGDFTHKEDDEDYDDDDEGSYRGRAYNNDDDEDDGKRQRKKEKGKDTSTMERSDELYESVETSPERQDQATSMKVTGGAFVHSLYVQSATDDDYEGRGGNYDEDDDDDDERGRRRVVSAGGYLDHKKQPSDQHSNDGQYFSYDEDDDEDEHEREEEREDDDDDDDDDDDESAVHGQRVRNEHGYYEDAKEVNSLYLAQEDDGESEDGDGKAIDAAYSSEHEVDSYPQDKVGEKRGRRKESGGGGLLRNFMRHSGEYRFRRRADGGGSSAEKYFAGDGSVKGSRRRERDERKRKAKEEKREKKTEKKLKRMDRKLVTVGAPRRKSERDHESGIGAGGGGEEGRHRWMRRATGRVELRRSQPKSKDFLSDDDDRGGGDDVAGSGDIEPAADDAVALGRTKISLRLTQPAQATGSDDEAERKAPTSRMLAFRRKRRSMSEIEPGGRRGGKAQQPEHSAPAADGGGDAHMEQRTMTASGKVPGARRMVTGLSGSMEDVGSLSSHDRSVSASGVAATVGGEGRVKRAFERRVMEAKKRIGGGRSNKKNIERKASMGEAGAVVDVEAFLQENIGADWQEKMSQRDDVSSTVSPATVTSTAPSGQHAALDNSPAAVAVAAAVASATALESDLNSSPAVGRRQLPVSPSLARRNAVGQLPDSIWNVRTFMRSTPHNAHARAQD